MVSSATIFRKASSDATENLRRERDWIRQTANLCAGSRREIESSYSLLREVQRDLDRGPRHSLAPRHVVQRTFDASGASGILISPGR